MIRSIILASLLLSTSCSSLHQNRALASSYDKEKRKKEKMFKGLNEVERKLYGDFFTNLATFHVALRSEHNVAPKEIRAQIIDEYEKYFEIENSHYLHGSLLMFAFAVAFSSDEYSNGTSTLVLAGLSSVGAASSSFKFLESRDGKTDKLIYKKVRVKNDELLALSEEVSLKYKKVLDLNKEEQMKLERAVYSSFEAVREAEEVQEVDIPEVVFQTFKDQEKYSAKLKAYLEFEKLCQSGSDLKLRQDFLKKTQDERVLVVLDMVERIVVAAHRDYGRIYGGKDLKASIERIRDYIESKR